MVSPLARIIAFVALGLAATTGFPARGVLHADGIIRVKGIEPSATSITVVPGGAASYSLQLGTMRFMLLLPLDDVYLITVAGEGCPTKEIYVDTRVPAEMHATDFEFPFMVTLEHLAAERMFVYAGPVGFVRYLHPLKDFGYETQYVVKIDERLKLRMDAVRATGMDSEVFVPMLPAVVVDRPRGEYSTSSLLPPDPASGKLAPIVSEVAPMVLVVNAAATLPVAAGPAASAFPLPGTEVVGNGPELTPIRSATIGKVVDAVAPRAVIDRDIPIARAIASPVTDEVTAVPSGPMTVVAWRSLRSEEMIAEARSLTRIVRFSTPSNGVIEFRKVTHAFGAVYYFQGTRSITERDFEVATAPELDGVL
ncbi:MAG: hypothetical protein IPL52_15215 [Flavobacteriales bacterium]|nr:hypothetical protein [Flavobacteriales bacterium]